MAKRIESGNHKNSNRYKAGIVVIILSAFFLICLCLPFMLSVMGYAVKRFLVGALGAMAYPIFLCNFVYGFMLIQNRKPRVRKSVIALILLVALMLALIIHLATSRIYLSGGFKQYEKAVYNNLTGGGVILGAVVFAVQAIITEPVSYVLYALLIVLFLFLIFKEQILDISRGNFNRSAASKNTKKLNYNEQDLSASYIHSALNQKQLGPKPTKSLFVENIAAPQKQHNTHEGSFSQLKNKIKSNEGSQKYSKPINNKFQDDEAVEFEPYNKKPDSNAQQDRKKAAMETLYGDRADSVQFTSLKEGGFNNFNKATVSPLPPDIPQKSDLNVTVVDLSPMSSHADSPKKPPKIVHLDDVGLKSIPMPPTKDITSNYIPGEILNGDEISQLLLGDKSAADKNKQGGGAEKTDDTFDFNEVFNASKKNNTEDARPPILNGDYYNTQKAEQKNIPAAPQIPQSYVKPQQNPIINGSEYKLQPQNPIGFIPPQKNEQKFNQNPIINGSDALRQGVNLSQNPFNSAKDDFISREDERTARIRNESERARRAIPQDFEDDDNNYDYNNEADNAEFETESGYENESESETEIENEIERETKNAGGTYLDDEPVIDRTQRNYDNINDQTGYYTEINDKNTVRSFANEPVPVKLKPENQIKIDEYIKKIASSDITASQKPKRKRTKYVAPPIDILQDYFSTVDEDESNRHSAQRAKLLEETLKALKVPATVTAITRGPTVTRFELEMPTGIPVKRIEQFSKDIAYYLESNGKIRMETPIPGKRAVGIEIPNNVVDKVGIKEILESKEFINSSSPLTVVLGKDIAGTKMVCCLDKMPHLLVAGATNSGKSVCLNSIIISILYKASPEDVRLILVDPKLVEFGHYRDMPHLLTGEIITDATQAYNAFKWLKQEVDRRYLLFSKYPARNLSEFNKLDVVKNGEEDKLPYIVLIVDELAELMLSNNRKDLEDKIMSLTQKARAAGIHLILATQRPSVDVITGTIKANLPSRIGFMVRSVIDSRTILDDTGAETLIGRGDMLYAPVGADDPKRIQGALVTNEEIAAVLQFVKDNNVADFDPDFLTSLTEPEESESEGEEERENDFDPLMQAVLKSVIECATASTTFVQRRFAVGYARASRIIDQMEMNKFIGPMEGNNKPRAIYITREQYKEMFGEEI